MREDFSLRLPEDSWEDHSTRESYDFRLGRKEQLVLVVHIPQENLSRTKLQETIVELYRIRLNAIQEHSGNSCTFESLSIKESADTFDVLVFGRDRRGVFLHVGFLGRPHRILVVSHYDYSGSRTAEDFEERAHAVLSEVRVKGGSP